jgi:monothiol glutaredoxin
MTTTHDQIDSTVKSNDVVLFMKALRNGIKEYTNWPTIPQLYVKGEFIGGADILMEMFQSGELKQLMADKGVVA